MPSAKTMIEQAYSAFNQRDISGALALMTKDGHLPPGHDRSSERQRWASGRFRGPIFGMPLRPRSMSALS
jgi:hypothetical protein